LLAADGSGGGIRERFRFQVHFFPLFIIVAKSEFVLELVEGGSGNVNDRALENRKDAARGIVLNNSCEVSSRSMGNSCRGLQLKWKTTPPEALPVTKEKFK